MNARATASATLASLASEVWEALLAREPYYAAKAGRSVERIPRGNLAEVEGTSAAARTRLRRLDGIDRGSLSRSERLTARHLAHVLQDEVDEPERWWSSFGVTPYLVGAMLSLLPELVFRKLPLHTPSDSERYLSLVRDLAACVETLHERTAAQAERGWRIPRPALTGVRVTLERITASLVSSLTPSEERAESTLRQRLSQAVQQQVGSAFNRLLESIGPEYERHAPEKVGLSQFPRGPEAYARWVRYHLSSHAEPEQVHAVGLGEVDRLATSMAELRSAAFGWNADEAGFHLQLRSNPRAKAASPEALERIYQSHLTRMEAALPGLVRRAPRARPLISRLQPALEAGMTFGFYDAPSSAQDSGTYFYSAYGLEDRLHLNAAALIFHELVPGHHVQIARQMENTQLPDIRRNTFLFSAFTEGWAEYSAGLGEELGAYADPYDRYGWLAHQRFVAQRLVVDTGLNWYGWSLERARQYMMDNTLEAAPQVASETLRYSTDMPGQALAYRMGFLKFRALREQAEQRLGSQFELADFHEAILTEGSLPLSVLHTSLEEWADLRLAERR